MRAGPHVARSLTFCLSVLTCERLHAPAQVFAARDDMRQAWTRMHSLFEAASHQEGLFACRVRRSTGGGSGGGAARRAASAGVAAATVAAAEAEAAAAAAPLVPAAALPAEEGTQQVAAPLAAAQDAQEGEELASDASQEGEQVPKGAGDGACAAPEEQARRGRSAGGAAAVAGAADPFAELACSAHADAAEAQQAAEPAVAAAAPAPAPAPAAVAGGGASRAELAAIVASHAGLRGEIAALSDQVRGTARVLSMACMHTACSSAPSFRAGLTTVGVPAAWGF